MKQLSLLMIIIYCTACEQSQPSQQKPLVVQEKDTSTTVEPSFFLKGQWADKAVIELMQVGELPASYTPIRIQTTKERHTYQVLLTNSQTEETITLATRKDLYDVKQGYKLLNKQDEILGYLDFETLDSQTDLLICNYLDGQAPFYRKGKITYLQIPLAVANIPQKYYAEGYYHVFDTAKNLVADEVELFANGRVQNFGAYQAFELSPSWEDSPLLSLQDSSKTTYFVLEDTDKGFELYEFKNPSTTEYPQPKTAQKGRCIWTFKRMKMYED